MSDENQDLKQVEIPAAATAIETSAASTFGFWIEMALTGLSVTVLMLTLTMPHWIERVFGFAADGRDGSTEWSLAAAVAVAVLALFPDVGRLRLRLRQASASTK